MTLAPVIAEIKIVGLSERLKEHAPDMLVTLLAICKCIQSAPTQEGFTIKDFHLLHSAITSANKIIADFKE